MLLLACAKHETPPALPDEPVVIDGFSSYTETSPVEIRQCASPEFRYMRGKKAVPMEESTGEESVPAKKIKPIDPEKLISTANSDARVKPTGTGYFGGRAMYRYQYNAGKIFDIHTNPGQFTNIYFPPGEHLATVPGLNPEKWEYGTGRIGSEGQQVEILRVRPLEPGLTVDIAVDMCHTLSKDRDNIGEGQDSIEGAYPAIGWSAVEFGLLAGADPEACEYFIHYGLLHGSAIFISSTSLIIRTDWPSVPTNSIMGQMESMMSQMPRAGSFGTLYGVTCTNPREPSGL